MDLPELEKWLDGFINFERRPDKNLLNLQTMQVLCAYFDHPEKSCPCYHVAGSKGKGTITADLAAIFRAAGYKTGCYMSPHVSHFTERVGTGAEPFAKQTYDAAFRQLKLGVDDLISRGEVARENLTWFELVTIFAMLCFRIEKVDIAIYEVGMGGRLDTTNIITPICCCFGPIELEHTRYLGETLAEIATEKAGIIKPGIPAVSAPQPPEAHAAFDEAAAKFSVRIDYVSRRAGDYLRQDAEVARRAAKIYLPNISDDLVDAAVRDVQLPGRFEIVKNIPEYPEIPYIMIDVAHTRNSIAAVLHRIKQEHLEGNLLFGCAADKDIAGIARLIKTCPRIKKIYLTRPGDFKQSDLTKMSNAFQRFGHRPAAVNPDFEHFIPEVLQVCNDTRTPLIVLGSFYLAGEVKKCYN